MAHGSVQFETTLWSDVLLAGHEPETVDGQKALARLCTIYWYPVYAHIRRRGVPVADAEDLTQGFFQHLLANSFLTRADPNRGRFRNFLLGAVRHFLSNERDKANSQRRGGSVERVSIDASVAEQWLATEPTAINDPTRAFDHAWAATVLHHALQHLESEQRAVGKIEQFCCLKEFIQRTAEPGEYERIAEQLGTTKGAVAASVHRLNSRLAELVRQMVRATVENSEIAEDELRHLVVVLRK